MLEDTHRATTVSINPKQLETLKKVQKHMEHELSLTLSRSRVVERVLNLYLDRAEIKTKYGLTRSSLEQS